MKQHGGGLCRIKLRSRQAGTMGRYIVLAGDT